MCRLSPSGAIAARYSTNAPSLSSARRSRPAPGRKSCYNKLSTVGYNGKVRLRMKLNIECEQEEDGRWLAEVLELPGVMVYGETEEVAIARVQALALRVIADRIEHNEAKADLM